MQGCIHTERFTVTSTQSKSAWQQPPDEHADGLHASPAAGRITPASSKNPAASKAPGVAEPCVTGPASCVKNGTENGRTDAMKDRSHPSQALSKRRAQAHRGLDKEETEVNERSRMATKARKKTGR